MALRVEIIDPLQDPRWDALLERSERASIFHTRGWLEALRRTYGYQPAAFTTSASGEKLENAVVFCQVKSWLTGCRMVSLPFSDHCQPLVQDERDLVAIVSFLAERLTREKWKHIELRPAEAPVPGVAALAKGEGFSLHRLDLRPDLETIFRNFHRNHIQRKLLRAEREKLDYRESRSEALLDAFYRLQLMTRRRHRLPPQPRAWFKNLIECMGERLKIRVVSKDGRPVASILTLSYKGTMVYKYGCSDARYHNLGGMPLLFWKTIQDAKAAVAAELDLGRSETDNEGLTSFKEHLGAVGSKLTYLRYPAPEPEAGLAAWKIRLLQNTFSRLPDSLQVMAGKALYRHVG